MSRSYGGAASLQLRDVPLWAWDRTWATGEEIEAARLRFRSAVPHHLVPALDQGPHPVCTGAAAAALLALADAQAGRPATSYSPAWLYLVGVELVAQTGGVAVTSQILDGVPLAATLQATVNKGARPWSSVAEPVDPVALRRELLGAEAGGAAASLAPATLPKHFRVLQLNPTVHNLLLSLTAGYAVAFSLRVDEELHAWFEDGALQEATAFLAPEGDLQLPRVATHACVIVDYDAGRRAFLCLNSFGPEWGQEGKFYIRENSLLQARVSDGDVYVLV